MYATLLEVYLGVKLLGYRVYICLAFVNTAKSCSEMVIPIYTLTNTMRVLISLNPLQYLVLSFFSILAFLVICSDISLWWGVFCF